MLATLWLKAFSLICFWFADIFLGYIETITRLAAGGNHEYLFRTDGQGMSLEILTLELVVVREPTSDCYTFRQKLTTVTKGPSLLL
jgi:hypothetical protein